MIRNGLREGETVPVVLVQRKRSLVSTERESCMSSSDKTRGNLANGSPPPVGTDAYAAWLERMQRTRGRHAAITKNLYTWSSYKHWADKVKGSWEDEPNPGKK
jgi:hypothetical protein